MRETREDVEVFKPCITLETKTATTRFEASFCIDTAREILTRSSLFDSVKQSFRLGLLKAYGKTNIILFEQGQVSLTPANDQEEAYHLLKFIGALLLGAVKCEKIGGKPVCKCSSICKSGCQIAVNSGIGLVNEIE